ncbi:MAG: phosphotransferase [Planctomycetes bacterium]|nr:phosphotransferase [Planctomycetota bacterium]
MPDPAAGDFMVISWGGCEQMALPQGPRRAQDAALRLYQTSTLRGRVHHALLRCACRAGLLGLWPRVRVGTPAAPAGYDWAGWREHVAGRLAEKFDCFALIFNRNKPQRFMAAFLSEDGALVGLAKVGLDARNNGLIENEANATRALHALTELPFRVPTLLADGTWQGHRFILMSPLPSRARLVPFRWLPQAEQALNRLEQTTATTRSIDDVSWWREACASRAELAPLVDLLKGKAGPMRLSRIHGDLCPFNLLLEDGALWIIDWEDSSAEGPWLTDWVKYSLSIGVRRAGWAPESLAPWVVETVRERQREADTESLAFALVYIAHHGHWPVDFELARALSRALRGGS